MCLLMTLAAALAASLAWYRKRRNGMKLETLSLMYWGAALMWMVDGFFRLAEGEPFLKITLDDALLGLLVVVSGLVAWIVLRRNLWQVLRAENQQSVHADHPSAITPNRHFKEIVKCSSKFVIFKKSILY
ncbi:MAG: hypothetical protein LBU45_02645 [Azoarcus sp.]|jgi:uncharacterized membrane protein YfcA|nr:hypothetical protein [Azoarcus sp.]